MSRRSFTAWLHLRRQQRRDDPVGDLARDVAIDPDWPRGVRSLAAFDRYLESCGACDGAHRSLRRAYAEWLTEREEGAHHG